MFSGLKERHYKRKLDQYTFEILDSQEKEIKLLRQQVEAYKELVEFLENTLRKNGVNI